MKVVFVSAPYSSASPALREDITRLAESVALTLWENGIATICPHLNSGHFSDHLDSDSVYYRRGYVEIAKRCDAIFVALPSRKAPGVGAETAVVSLCGKPVFKDTKKCLYWAKKGEK